MTAFQILQILLPILTPLIKDLISKTKLPLIAKNSYKNLDMYSSRVLDGLAELKQKINDEPDSIKKEIRVRGFKLGCNLVRNLAEKLIKGVDILENIEEYKEQADSIQTSI